MCTYRRFDWLAVETIQECEKLSGFKNRSIVSMTNLRTSVENIQYPSKRGYNLGSVG
jgi:hypothetical protein